VQVRWTEEAADDLERIADYLFERVPDLAPDLVRDLFDAPAALLNISSSGTPPEESKARGSWS
jgi:plasmid stabilization system protein ParE